MSKQVKETPLDEVFVVYPRHLMWLMDEYQLTVPEISVLLGFPSIQEWYNVCREPDVPVRNIRVVQSARIYLRNPSMLPDTRPPLQALIDRTFKLFEDKELASSLLEIAFHKQWSTITSWLQRDAKTSIDLSARRLIQLLMDLDDDEFQTALLDAAVSTHVQKTAKGMKTFADSEGKRLYATDNGVKLKLEYVLPIVPKPGRRLSKNEFVVPDTPPGNISSQLADARRRHDETDDSQHEGTSETHKALQHIPWNTTA